MNQLMNEKLEISGNLPTKNMRCDQCSFETNTTEQLNRHKRDERIRTPTSCTHCNYTAYSTEQLRSHEQIHITVPIKCSICGFEETKYENLLVHITTKHPHLKCDKCSFNFNST